MEVTDFFWTHQTCTLPLQTADNSWSNNSWLWANIMPANVRIKRPKSHPLIKSLITFTHYSFFFFFLFLLSIESLTTLVSPANSSWQQQKQQRFLMRKFWKFSTADLSITVTGPKWASPFTKFYSFLQSCGHFVLMAIPEHARSRLLLEAKQGWALLVLGWETSWEYQAL